MVARANVNNVRSTFSESRSLPSLSSSVVDSVAEKPVRTAKCALLSRLGIFKCRRVSSLSYNILINYWCCSEMNSRDVGQTHQRIGYVYMHYLIFAARCVSKPKYKGSLFVHI